MPQILSSLVSCTAKKFITLTTTSTNMTSSRDFRRLRTFCHNSWVVQRLGLRVQSLTLTRFSIDSNEACDAQRLFCHGDGLYPTCDVLESFLPSSCLLFRNDFTSLVLVQHCLGKPRNGFLFRSSVND